MEDILSRAGLRNILVQEVPGTKNFGTAERYWEYTTEVVAPVAGALSSADEATRAQIKREVFEAIKQRFPDGKVVIPSSAIVISGVK